MKILPYLLFGLASALSTTAIASSADKKPLGATPTFYYSLPIEEVLRLAQKDNAEGRNYDSKTNPSYLNSNLIGVKNVPGIADGIYSNAFAANNGYVCVTFITIVVPKRGGNYSNSAAPTGTQLQQNAMRYCSNTTYIAPSMTNFRRDAGYKNGPLQGLYNNSNLDTLCKYGGLSAPHALCDDSSKNKTQIFTDRAVVKDNYSLNETWGLSLFDKTGADGLLQEMVIVTVQYR